MDVTIQAQILTLLKDLQKKLGMALLLITHDLGIVRKMADRVCVMQKGEMVEQAPAANFSRTPQHPYTQMLLAAEPKGEALPVASDAAEILRVDDLKVISRSRKASCAARSISCARSTAFPSPCARVRRSASWANPARAKPRWGLASCACFLRRARRFHGAGHLTSLTRRAMRPFRRSMQIVFQDPYGSLSPRMSIGDIVAEGLDIHKLATSKAEREQRVIEALKKSASIPLCATAIRMNFPAAKGNASPSRARLILKPKFVVLDEPTSALDMSVQAQIVDLLRDLQKKHGLAYIFISHDIRVVRALSHEMIVMKDGKAVEQGAAAEIFAHPREAYTKALLAAALNIVSSSPASSAPCRVPSHAF